MSSLVTTRETLVVPSPVRDGTSVERRRLRVRGVVQGVGFRPFVWTLAVTRGLGGTVRNTSGAVLIDVEGPADALDAFTRALRDQAPVLAHIQSFEVEPLVPVGARGFRIEESLPVAGESQPVAPDAATCSDCLAELSTPGDRRHGYPFINCTSCGPRFTIIEDIPYDRAATTMRAFRMCRECRSEYDDPGSRRFHAQPNACARCGPRLWLAGRDGRELSGDPLALAVEALRAGEVLAIKGMGGFQLACAAGDAATVARLRRRKHRPSKPFAVMAGDLAGAAALGEVDAAAARLLQSPAAPVVLLPRRPAAGVCAEVAPALDELGVMLPSTPLHHLLLRAFGAPLVMTSGNLSEEPIACDNAEAVTRLTGIADAFLLHDRRIAARYDDSVVRVAAGEERLVRRARGYSPLPIAVDATAPPILALGAHLKNTFCVLRGGEAFVGPHLGDLDQPLTLRHQADTLSTYLRLFRVRPAVVACDLHPDYASTRLAEAWWERGARAVQVQHHHAHIASVMAEHGLRGPLLGVAFDGAGLGSDGSVWGGEFLLCDERSSRRVGSLVEVALPGGDRCAREGWRMALAHLRAVGASEDTLPGWAADGVDERSWRLVGRVVDSPVAPRTSSAGRLFDAVASVLGAGHVSGYEGEAAMRLEALACAAEAAEPLEPLAMAIHGDAASAGPLRLDTSALVAELAELRTQAHAPARLAALFHESLARGATAMVMRLAGHHGLGRVALSGGVFQNRLLLERCVELLGGAGLEVYANRQVPSNDGGVSLGQALVAAALSPGTGEGG